MCMLLARICCMLDIDLVLLQAVERLNIKANFWRDLITDEPFTRKDLITIQVIWHKVQILWLQRNNMIS